MQELESRITDKAHWTKWQEKSVDWMKSGNLSDLKAAWIEAFKKPAWLAGAVIATAAPFMGPTSTVTVDGLLKPSGNFIGTVLRGATSEIRTVSSGEFAVLQNQLLKEAKPSGFYAAGNGTWYDLPTGGRVGVRASQGAGLTLDIDIPGYPKGFKVHQQ